MVNRYNKLQLIVNHPPNTIDHDFECHEPLFFLNIFEHLS